MPLTGPAPGVPEEFRRMNWPDDTEVYDVDGDPLGRWGEVRGRLGRP